MKLWRRSREPVDILVGYSGLNEIGKGPFATVYGAVEEETGRPVAVKVFDAGAELMEVLFKDFQTTAGLDHPNIVKTFRLGASSDGHPVVVTDLCRESLGRVVDSKGPIGAEKVAGTGVKIAAAIATMHDAGILHQNLKPTNILTTLMGEPAVADAGAASIRLSVNAVGSGASFTAIYAAPEMFETRDLSEAADVYGLASTLYRLLTGRAPFDPFEHESPASLVLRVLRDPVAPVPPEFAPYRFGQLLESALSKDPADRPQSALAFGEALREIAALEGWSVSVPQPPKVPVPPVQTPSTDSDPLVSSRSWLGRRRTRPGISTPPPAGRNVVLPEEARRGRMDRPPRRS